MSNSLKGQRYKFVNELNKKAERVGHQWKSIEESLGLFSCSWTAEFKLPGAKYQSSPNGKLLQRRVYGRSIFRRLCLRVGYVSFCGF